MVCVDLVQRSGYSIEQDGDISFGLVGFGDDAMIDKVEAVMSRTETAYSSPDDVLYIYILQEISPSVRARPEFLPRKTNAANAPFPRHGRSISLTRAKPFANTADAADLRHTDV